MTHTAANVDWRQLPGEESVSVEIRLPIIIAPTTANSDISVTVADSTVVVVKAAGALLWQCRLYAPVSDEVDWTLEKDRSILAMEVSKMTPEIWPSLLNVPLKINDPYLLTRAELDERISRELPALPPVDAEANAASDEKETAKEEATEEKKEDTAEAEKNDGETPEAEKKEETTEAAKEEEAEEKETAEENAEEKETAEEKTEETAEDNTEEKEPAEAEKTADEAADGEEPSATIDDAKEKVDEETKAEEKDPLDLLDDDALLDDALAEVTGVAPAKAPAAVEEEKKADGESSSATEEAIPESKKKSEEEEEAEKEALMAKAQTEAELRGIQMETDAITERLEEMIKELAEASPGTDKHDTLTLHVKIASRMLELVRETRALRSQPATIDNFIKVQIADINKARINIGETDPQETEEFQNEMEKSLSGLQLFKGALQYLNSDPAVAVHLLRLAAIHHHHAPSVIALMSIYTSVPTSYPRGASLILHNALRGEGHDVEARTNSRVGDLFNSGTRHFPPVFSLAVYFHQRAAVAGNTHSMVSLAQLFLAGECSGDDTMAPSLRRLNKDEKRANYFLQCAIDRGSIVAYLIRAAQYATGTEGMPKSLDMAEKYYKKAIAAESSLTSASSAAMRIGSRMTLGELAALFAPKPTTTTTTTAPAAKPTTTTTTTVKPAADDDDDIIELRPTTSSSIATRGGASSATSSLTASGARMGYQSQGPSAGASSSGVVAAPAKRNTGFAASANKRKANWERAARWGITAYALYVIAFPVRLIMMPMFYEVAANVMDFLGLSTSNAGSIDAVSF